MDTKPEHGLNFNELYTFDVSTLPYIWSRFVEIVEKNPKGFDEYYTLEFIYEHVRKGNITLWGIVESNGDVPLVVLTSIFNLPRCKTLNVLWIGGQDIKKHLPNVVKRLTQTACFEGCAHLEIQGRKGWERLLKPYGVRKEIKLVKNTTMLWSN